MIDSLGAGQDNVVFLGRRSFRMELVGRPDEDEPRTPRRASEVPTEKIFDSDREHAARAVPAAVRSQKSISRTTSIVLCATTFVLGIGSTLTFLRRPEPRRPMAAAAPTTPAPAIVIEPVPSAQPPRAPAPPAIPTARQPFAKPARAVRPRPMRAARPDAPAPKPWVDPFAE